MTWGELKEFLEDREGISDDDEIAYIDIARGLTFEEAKTGRLEVEREKDGSIGVWE